MTDAAQLARGEELDMRAIEEALEEWVEDGNHEKAARAIMGSVPVEIGEAICDLKMNEAFGEGFFRGPENPVGGPSVPLPWVEDTSLPTEEDGAADAAAFNDHATALEPFDDGDIELHVTDQAFEPSYGGWTVQFSAIGAPRLAHQTMDPSLEAFVKLEVIERGDRLLAAGGSTALARTDEGESSHQALVMLTGSVEGNILASGLGAASIDTGQVHEVPLAMPSDDVVLAAMKKSLEVHLGKVREERARLKVTEGGAGFVGRRFKVKAGGE